MSIAHESNDLVLFGLQGGASWPGSSVDPRHGIIYISSNDIPWKIKLSRKSRKSLISKLLMSVIQRPQNMGVNFYHLDCLIDML